MKFCAQCLHQLNTSAKFCYHCGGEIEGNQLDIPEIRQQVGAREIETPTLAEKRQGGSRLIGETVKKTDVVLELMEMVGSQKKENENISDRWEEKLLGENRPRKSRQIDQSEYDRKLNYDNTYTTSDSAFSASSLLQEELSKLDKAVERSLVEPQNQPPLQEKIEQPYPSASQSNPQRGGQNHQSRLVEGGNPQANTAISDDYLKKLGEMLLETQLQQSAPPSPKVVESPPPQGQKLPSFLEEFMATGRIPKLTDEMIREMQEPQMAQNAVSQKITTNQPQQVPPQPQTNGNPMSQVNPLTQINAIPQSYIPTPKPQNQGNMHSYLAEFMATGRIPQLTDEMMAQVLVEQQTTHPTQPVQTPQTTENQVKLPSYLEEFIATGRIPQVTEEMLREIQQPQSQIPQSPTMPVVHSQEVQQPMSGVVAPIQTQTPTPNVRSTLETVQAEEEKIQEKNAKALEELQVLMNSIGMSKSATIPQEIPKQQSPQPETTPQIPQNTPLPTQESLLISGETAKLLGVMDTLHQITADTAPIPQIEKSPPTPKVEIIPPPKPEEPPVAISENMERKQLSDCLKLCYEAILALGVANEELIIAKQKVKRQNEKVEEWNEKIDDYEDVSFLQKTMVATGFFALFSFAFWFLGMLGFLVLKMTPILDDVPISEFSIWTGVCVFLSSISVFLLMNRRRKIHQEDLDELEFAKKTVTTARKGVEDAYAVIRDISKEENTKFMVEFLPQPYATLDAVSSFITYLENRRADTLKEAMNIYEAEKQNQKMQELQQINLEAITGANKLKNDEEDGFDQDGAPFPVEKVDLEKTAQWKKDTARRQARLNMNSQRISKQVRFANAITVIDLGNERH